MDANDIDGDGVEGNNPVDGTTLDTINSGNDVWADRSPSGNNLDINGGAPIYNDSTATQVNGYPLIQTGSAGSFETSTPGGVDEGIAYFVARYTDNNSNNFLARNTEGGSNDDYLYVDDSSEFYGQYDIGSTTYTDSTISSDFDEPVIVSYSVTDAGSTTNIERHKTQSGSAHDIANISTNAVAQLPYGNFGTNTTQMEYAEIIYYDAIKNAAEKIRIESYLAAKYGFTYHDAGDAPTDMEASDGTLMRDVSAAGDWTTRAFVIGQDDTSGLLNSSSTTNDTDDAIVSVSGASDQNNLEFVSFADNNKQKTTSVEVDLTSGGRVLRLSRSWRHQTFGGNGAGTVDLVFDLNKQTALDATGTNTADYVIMIDDDANDDFTNASIIESSSVAAGIVTFSGLTLTDGTVVTIAEPGPAIQYPFTEPLETVEFGEDEILNDGTIRTDGNVADTPMTLTIEDDTWASSITDGTDMTLSTHYTITGTIPAGLSLAVHKVDATNVELRMTGSATANDNADDTSFTLNFLAAAFETTEVASYVLNSSKEIGINFIDPNIINVELSGSTASTPGTGFPAGEDAGAAANLFPELLVEGTIVLDQTVDFAVTGGTATGAGADFTYGGATNVVTVTIPAGQYDGTTTIDLGDPTLTQDIAIEGNETIELTLQNVSDPAVVFIADTTVATGDADAVAQSTFTFTITDDDTSGIAGVVYGSDRSTPLSGKVVRLLVNGADPLSGAIYDTTDSSGVYELEPVLVNTYDKDDVLTLFLDDETENGATVVLGGTDDADILAVDIYQDHLRLMDDGSTAGLITNANLVTGAAGDTDTSGTTGASAGSTTDLSDLWTNPGGVDLDLAGGLEIATGDTYAPGGSINIEGDFINLGSYTTAGESVIFDGAANQSFTSNGSPFSIIVNDAGFDTATAAVTSTLTLGDALSAQNLTNADGETLDLVGYNFTLSGGLFNGNTAGIDSALVRLYGSQTMSILTPDVDSGTFEYYGNGTGSQLAINVFDFGATDYYNLSINDVSATNSDSFDLTAGTVIANNLSITDGELDTESNSLDVAGNVLIDTNGTLKTRTSAVTVEGNWTNNGTYTADTASVTLDGTTDQNVLGTSNFYNLTLADTGARVIGFVEDVTQTISNTFTADASTGQTLTLRAVDAVGTVLNDLSQFTLNVLGSLGVIDYVDVRDSVLQESGVTKSPELDPANSTDSSNTAGWFSGVSISGTVYSDAGTTAYTTADTVNIFVNGVSDGTGTINAGDGTYSVTLSALPAADAVITVFIDDDGASTTNDAVTVTRHDGVTAQTTGVDLYIDHLITRTETANPLTPADLDTSHDGAEADLTAIYADGAAITTATAKTLYVWAGDTLDVAATTVTLNGDVYVAGTYLASGLPATDINGNVTVAATGTMTTGANHMTIAGNFTNNGSFTNNNLITLDGTTAQTFTSGSGTYSGNLSIQNTSADVTLGDTYTGTGTGFTIAPSATLVLNGNNLVISSATIQNQGTLRLQGSETVTIGTQDLDSGTWEYVGNGTGSILLTDIKDFGAGDYFNLVINDASASNSDVFRIASTLEVAGDLTITDAEFDLNDIGSTVTGTVTIGTAGTLIAGSGTMNVAGNWVNEGTFTADSSTISFNGTADQHIRDANTWNNLTIADTGARTLGIEESLVQTVAGTFTSDLSSGQVVSIASVDTAGAASTGTQHTFNVTGSFGTVDYVTVTDSLLQESGVTKNPELNPASSTNGGNTDGWISTAAPGGVVNNLVTWFKANDEVFTDAGTTPATEGTAVQQWNDQSNSSTNATQLGGAASRPTFRDSSSTRAFNNNPVLDFDGTDSMDHSDASLPTGTAAVSFFGVYSKDTFAADMEVYEWGNNNVNATIEVETHSNNSPRVADDSTLTLNSSAQFTGTEIPDIIHYRKASGTTDAALYLNSALVAINTSHGSHSIIADGDAIIGNAQWDGAIGEIIMYAGDTTLLERQQIDSYLAMKYGISLTSDNDGDTTPGEVLSGSVTEGDYVLSDGSTIAWDYSANSTYHNDVAVVSRDDNSGLSQLSSSSSSTDGIVTVTNGGTPATPTAFTTNLEYLSIGNDNTATAWATDSGTNDLDDAPTGYQVFDRNWKVQEAATVGTVSIEVDVEDADFDVPALVSGSNYFLVVDTDIDGDYSDETPVQMYDDGTNGDQSAADNVWTLTTTDFDSGETFTLATAITSGLDVTVLLESFALDNTMDQTSIEVELRSGSSATEATTTAFASGTQTLDATGTVTGIDTSGVASGDYYVVVKQAGPGTRTNHLSIMTANKVTFSGGPVAIDFSDTGSGNYQAAFTEDSFAAQTTLATGSFSGRLAMRSGDVVTDSQLLITVSDIQVPFITNNAFLCSSTNGQCTWNEQWDVNGDDIVTATDLTAIINNFQRQSYIPK